MNQRTTIVDVAKKACVSVATCSRVLSGSDYPVKESTKEAILQAAKELNYQANPFSRMLKGKVNSHIGVIVPSITNPFYSEILNAIQETSLKRGFIPIICSSSNNVDLEQKFIEMMKVEQVSGILISCINWSDATLDRLEKLDIPFIVFDQVDEHYAGSYVGFDFYEAGRLGVRFLSSYGHSNLVFASGPIERISRKQFSSGFTDQAERYNIEHQIVIEEGDGDYKTGLKLGNKILGLEELPSAVIAVNDLTAMGIIKSFSDNNVNVPADISVLGFDDIPYAGMVTPALTTIRQSASKTGQEAARMLIDKIQGKNHGETHILFKPELMERKSVRKKHRKFWREK